MGLSAFNGWRFRERVVLFEHIRLRRMELRNSILRLSLSEKDIGAGGLTLELRVKVGRNKKAEAEHYPNAIKQANQFDYAKGDQAIRASPDR
jgi:hypothetical protein